MCSTDCKTTFIAHYPGYFILGMGFQSYKGTMIRESTLRSISRGANKRQCWLVTQFLWGMSHLATVFAEILLSSSRGLSHTMEEGWQTKQFSQFSHSLSQIYWIRMLYYILKIRLPLVFRFSKTVGRVVQQRTKGCWEGELKYKISWFSLVV